jgi:hypothetical protein
MEILKSQRPFKELTLACGKIIDADDFMAKG